MASNKVRESGPPRGSCGRQVLYLGAACAMLHPAIAAAEFRFQSFVAEQATHQSNVFSLSPELQAQLRPGDPRQSDWLFSTLGGVDAGYTLGLQRIYAEAHGARVKYQNFSELDHDEYGVGAGLGWNVLEKVDGTVDVRQERRMASFVNRRSTELTLEQERVGNVGLGLNVGPSWRVETGARYYELRSPLPDFPDFKLRETAYNGALKYKSEARLALGVFGEYLEGSFSGITDAPDFHSTTGDVTADYDVSELARLSAKVGYTKLQGSDIEVSGVTGSLMFRREISAVTELKLEAYRRIEGYLAGANAIVDTGFAGGVTWHPGVRVRVDADYTYIYSEFEALAPVATISAERRDVFQIISASVGYQVLPWIGLRVFGGYRDRDSNARPERFDNVTFGGEIRLQFPGADVEQEDRDRDERERRPASTPRRPT